MTSCGCSNTDSACGAGAGAGVCTEACTNGGITAKAGATLCVTLGAGADANRSLKPMLNTVCFFSSGCEVCSGIGACCGLCGCVAC